MVMTTTITVTVMWIVMMTRKKEVSRASRGMTELQNGLPLAFHSNPRLTPKVHAQSLNASFHSRNLTAVKSDNECLRIFTHDVTCTAS